jgi:DNA-binding transcriptional MerR regulator
VALKVGELAKRTGVSVRTLHHYGAIGLLSPPQRTETGHRLYGDGEIVRLQQIISLRQLGFSLEEIRECLARPDYSLRRVIALHLERLREQIEALLRLCERLEALGACLRSTGDLSVDEFLQTIEEMIQMEKYYTPEQRDELRTRGAQLGEEWIRQVEAEWPTLIEQVRAERDKGTPPTDERVRQLARRWVELVNEFTGDDPGITQSLGRTWRQEQVIHGMGTASMRELMECVLRALARGSG